jgi:hypothetical protein
MKGLEFTTCPTNGRSKSIEMDVGVNGRVDGGTDPRIKFEVDGVVGLSITSMKLC